MIWPGLNFKRYVTIHSSSQTIALKVHKHYTQYVFYLPWFGNKRRKRVFASADGKVTQNQTIKLDTMIKTEEISAESSHLDTAVANMDY